ncbi:MAG: response regulator transcription factor [Planctomycetota bacterium]
MNDPRRILVVDDEPDLAELLAYNLQREGFETRVAHDGLAAIEQIEADPPDLVVLDVMMPELSGLEVARRLRHGKHAGLPILMLTAKTEEADEVAGFAEGTDDYMTKPFSMRVLLARIRALLRRAAAIEGESAELSIGSIRLDLGTHQAFVDGHPIALTVTEFRILSALMEASGKVQDRRRLIARAMGPGVTVTERTVDVHVTSIRKKLGDHAGVIKTVRGVGYRLIAEDDASCEV